MTMPNFRYRALNERGDVVSGSISAGSVSEVAVSIERLGLMPIDTVLVSGGETRRSSSLFARSARPEDVTIFTRDLALLLRAGARIDDALESMASEPEFGRLRTVIAELRTSVVSGESFADALVRHDKIFPPIYVALVRVAEASGTLEQVLEALAEERARVEQLQRKVYDSIRYPAFILLAAGMVLAFFLLFVIPQFSAILRDFGAKVDPLASMFFGLSDFLRANPELVEGGLIATLLAIWLMFRQQTLRAWLIGGVSRLPLVSTMIAAHRTAIFCRNLGLLLANGVALTAAMRMLVELVSNVRRAEWTKATERVRQGGKLSDALAEANLLPAIAIRMLRLGEETGQLAMLSTKVAEFFEARLQRSLDRVVGVVGPAAIVLISIVVGGLIVSIMTSLLSINQIIG